MSKYAIVQEVGSVNEEGESTGSGWGLATAVPLDEATVRNLQRLGGRMEDAEAAMILLDRRLRAQGLPPELTDDELVAEAQGHGLWDPQIGEVTT